MKFKYVKKVDEPVTCYTGEMLKTGDVIDLTGHLANKALTNPDYELVSEVVKPVVKKTKQKSKK